MKGGGYGASAQQKQFREAEDSFFYDDFGGGINNQAFDFWLKLPDGEKPEEDQIIFQGRLWQKTGKHKKWTSFHFELYSDKLIRIFLSKSDGKKNEVTSNNLIKDQPPNKDGDQQKNNTNYDATLASAEDNTKINTNIFNNPQINNNGGEELAIIEYIPINQCFLKKIKYSDNSYSNYKYGIRLQRGEQKSELFTENSDTFNKWHDEVKRYCILPKFQKKYKVLTKLKMPVQLPNSAAFFKCFRFSDSIQYCVRIVEKYTLSDSNKQTLLKEIQILRKLDNPYVCRLYEIYEDENNIYIVTELFQGKDLKAKLAEGLILDEKTVSEIMRRLLQGLHHMHYKGIFHRDIKLENIQFRSPQNITDICLSNFFMADFFSAKNKSAFKKCGTAGFIAPEIFKTKNYDSKVDIFSLGVVFYILIFGKMPFDSTYPDQIITLNEQCEIEFNNQECAIKCTSSAIELMKNMLQKDPSSRFNAFQLMNHAWFVNMSNRGEDGRMRNNLYGMPTLSTIQERTSEILEIPSKQDPFNPRNPKVCEENNNGFETLNQKMRNLNSTIFSKVPSKPRHDMALSKHQ